jgi:probable HAF family extracellular repeat protein
MSVRVRARLGAWLAALLCALAAAAHAAPPRAWRIVDLGSAGGWGSRAMAVNNHGDVAGETGVGSTFAIHAFLWQNGQFLHLGAPPPATIGFVRGITDRGAILVNSEFGRSYLWKDGTYNELPVDAAQAINKFESVVGAYSPFGMGGTHAYLLSNGVFHDLGTLGGRHSRATSLNDRGAVVGASSLAGELEHHAFLYEDATMKDLGTLGGRESTAYDVNNRGVVVGSSFLADGSLRPFIHDGTVMRPLPWPGGLFAEAVAINDRGAIVGRACCTPRASGWLLEDGVVTRLDDIAEVRAAGWTEVVPADISERGWIVGQGTNAHGPRAFLLMPR